MGHRSIVLLLGAVLALVSSNVMALGLGKITLDSSLNQPLKAQIELFEVRELQKEEIRVNIASREDFERIGVDKVYFLSDLTFDVVLNGASSYINVTSEKVVREPFLNFVVQVQWPSGKLLREYTLLMDLPAFSETQAPAVQPTTSTPSSTVAPPPTSYKTPSQTAQPGSSYNPRSEYQDAPSRPSSEPLAPSYTEDSYTVRANDTLWEIAVAVRPDRAVTIHQTMIAIQRSNPEAFINNNINLLREGQILRIPDRDEMSAMGRGEAVREVADQNTAWSGGQATQTDVSEAQLSGTDAYNDYEAESSTPEGRLKLASPDDSYESSEGRTVGGEANVSTDALENELAIAREQLDKLGRDNADLSSKAKSFEEQVETLELMVESKNRELEALKASIEKSEEAAALAEQARTEAEENLRLAGSESAESVTDDLSAAEQTVDDVVGSAVDDTVAAVDEGVSTSIEDLYGEATPGPESEASPEQAESVDPVVEAAPSPVVEEPEKQDVVDRAKTVAPPPVVSDDKSIVDIILDNVLFILGGIVALAAGAFFLMRQKSSDEEDFDDFMSDQGLDQELPEDEVPQEEAYEEDIDLGDFSEEPEDEPRDASAEDEIELDAESEPQTEDVVAEADIYIAYGKFDQAEEMLLKSLADDPGDQDVRLKLMEVYSTQGDAESFDPHFAKLREIAPPTVVERAENLRSNIPNVAEFDEGSFDVSDVTQIKPREAVVDPEPETPVEDVSAESDSLELDLGGLESDADDDVTLDLDLPDEPAEELDVTSSDAEESLDLDLDFDLPESEEGEESSFDLELDLPDDDANDVDFEIEEPKEVESELSLDLDDGLSLDSGLDSSIEEESASQDYSADELDLDLDLDDADKSSLEADLASLDAELDLSVNLESDAKSDLAESLDDEIDLSMPSSDATDFSGGVTSDTVINDALNDEYIEQKLAEDPEAEMNLDEPLPLEEAEESPLPDLDDDSDLDLSSLDEELDALTASVDEDVLSSGDAQAMDEPVTDFDDFEDHLEKDEALAETVKSDHASADDVEEMGEDTMFNQAISEVPSTEDSDLEFELPEINPEDLGDDDLEFLSDSDETATKLDLARAYIDMGDQEGARDIIREVMGEGNDQQKSEAEGLLARIDG